MQIKMRGIYDQKLFEYLKKTGVKQFAFDLRPTSFNFTPMRSIVNMLDAAGEEDDRYFFMFGSEKDFVIEQLMSFVRKKPVLNSKNCFLEFTDPSDFKKCSDFGLPFLWRFDEKADYRKGWSCEKLKGISLSYKYLESLQETNQLWPFIMEFSKDKRNDQWIDLRLDWSDQISESVIDFLPVHTYSYEINTKVEESYRSVNMGMVGSHLEHARRILNLEP